MRVIARWWPLPLPLALAVLTCSFGSVPDESVSRLTPPAEPVRPLVTDPGDRPPVTTFLYQLQNLELDAVAATSYDLVVMDYSATGEPAAAYTRDQLAALQEGSTGSKILLAYLSIGEAEDYRYYWLDDWDKDGDGDPDAGAPAWLDRVNPDWDGNYKVRYWEPGWQAIIFGTPDSYLDRILAAGFDGVYLDIIDGYEFYQELGRESAAQEMVDFVIALANYARVRRPDFLVFPQNAAELAADFPAYLAAIDGIGQEDLYYGYEADGEPTPPEVVAELERYLDIIVAAGKTVLLTAYTSDWEQIEDHYGRARSRGYIPFATVRELDELVINPGFEPE